MKKIILFLSMAGLLIGCSSHESKFIIFESDIDDIFNRIEAVESHLDDLVSYGEADEFALLELRDEVNSLKTCIEESIIDEDDVEPHHLRR